MIGGDSSKGNWAGRPLSAGDAALLSAQIAGLARSGLPLPSGLRALGDEMPRGGLRRVLHRLADRLERGEPLDVALAGQGGRLPDHLRGLVVAGVRTGDLGVVLGRFAGFAQVGVDLRRSLRLRLVYPLICLAFASVVAVFACVVVATTFASIFSDFGVPIPMISRWVLTIARAVSAAWWPLLLVLLVTEAGLIVTDFVLHAGFWNRLVSSLPLFGTIWHLTALAEFSDVLGLLIESEVPLVEALPMAGAAVGNLAIAEASGDAARDVAAGRPLSESLTRRWLFSEGFARVLAWAEAHHGLPEALRMASEMFIARARSQADFVGTFCNAAAMLMILGGVATVVLAVMIPMITLLSKLM